MDENGIKRKITELKSLVGKIHVLLPLARRPLIIEFSGTPKAGKTVAAGRLDRR